jgi:hypothetical protein
MPTDPEPRPPMTTKQANYLLAVSVFVAVPWIMNVFTAEQTWLKVLSAVAAISFPAVGITWWLRHRRSQA